MSADDIKHLESIISDLEGRVFGGTLRFSCHGYNNQLNISMQGGWHKVEGFSGEEEMRQFAAEMEAAVAPVREKYARLFRQKLVNVCVELAAKEMPKEPEA